MELRQIVHEIEPLENEKLTTSKHNLKQLKQTAEEIKKAMTVSAYETNEESQLDQVYIFEPKMEPTVVSKNLKKVKFLGNHFYCIVFLFFRILGMNTMSKIH